MRVRAWIMIDVRHTENMELLPTFQKLNFSEEIPGKYLKKRTDHCHT